MFENIKTPIIFAHRGDSANAPENTIASFELAYVNLADAVELDAKLTRDEKVVVVHDQTLDRTTDGFGKINDHTLAELKQLDAGSKFDQKFSGEKIPTLDEVFESVGKKLFVNVELTNYSSSKDNLIERVAEIVKKHKMEERVLFSSFLPGNLIKIKRLLPFTPVGLLCLSGFGGVLSRSFLFSGVSREAIHPFITDVNQKYVNHEHSRHRRIHVWTVNDEADLRRMFLLKVDGVFTDDPLKARKIMESI
jgi:glycerophosphoryl diester phosphodiesterase